MKERITEIPADSRALISLLNKTFPHQCIAEDETPEQAHRRAGMRELVDWLIDLASMLEQRAERANQSVRLK